jgi:protein-L-isoaspartate(D-aspartate) O-methyltransferase
VEGAEWLRQGLVDDLLARDAVRGAAVEAAMRAVPRHLFLPGTTLDQAYADDVVRTKQDDAGVPISAASQPSIVALMLEALDVRPGHRVLEIGAGTGYNAALLAHLVGGLGRVTTVDVDEDIVERARRGLAAAGFADVTVVCGDGAVGHPAGAPYDRLIATVGAGRVPRAWLRQLTPDGRFVVPLRLRGSVSRAIAFVRGSDGAWRGRHSDACAFMPLRGIADDAGRFVPLTADSTISLEAHPDQSIGRLVGVLDESPVETLTGVAFEAGQSFEWLGLWLACRLDNALSRLTAPPNSPLGRARTGLLAMAAVDGPNLAYLNLTPSLELSVVAHGPSATTFAQHVAAEIRTWDRDYRSREVEFALGTAGTFTFDNVSITWLP